MKREKFSSRLGFLLISAGCAIGLGNVWRFPYIVGKYGGAAFVLIYLFFLAALGLPIMVMEFSVGRASGKSAAASFRVLEPKGSRWHIFGYVAMAGNYLLMMFYTTIGGWMIAYLFKMLFGSLSGLSTSEVEAAFVSLQQSPLQSIFWMALTVALGFFTCSFGLQKGVERVTKKMMSVLFIILLLLAVHALTLPGAGEGLRFYLIPDFQKMAGEGLFEAVFAAMGQAFFTLSIGIGSMAIFGSYLQRERSLTGEALSVTVLDTIVALLSGLIIFPTCFSYGVSPGSGAGLVFITLPGLFGSMPGGRWWGALFFVFLSFTALSTIIAIFENIIAFAQDLWGWTRKKAAFLNMAVVTLLSLPACLGFSLLSGIEPLGPGSAILDLEDFIVSNNLLPLGSLVYLLFCVTRYGWGFENFLAEADAGKGMRFPRALRGYVTFILPAIVLIVFIGGYMEKFF